ncbi:MAG: 4-phosphoerythronate dehydrogenase [Bacteroidia bacterium]|nr:4-phosphoerythronate dehydrogenase [Bacteroidia bacterium]
MKIVVDSAIPFVQGVFEPYANVLYKQGDKISPEDVKDADALLIRTRTKCDASMLDGSAVKLISTATIGTDNIDLEYCRDRGIFVRNASGCNAGGVMNYVFSALYGVAARKSIKLDGYTFGIIGAGSAGRRVEAMARSLGFRIMKNDPPRMREEGPYDFCSLDELLEQSDIISFHVPLNDRTRGMADEEFFRKVKPGAIFINVARGELVVDSALKEAVPKLGAVIIDTWNNEPFIDKELMNAVDIATPHIAGYSYQGKQNSTAAAVRTVARFFDIKPLLDFFPSSDVAELEAVKLDIHGKSQGQIASLFQYNYPIFTDDFMFRVNPDGFVDLRANYSYRREFFID